MERIKTILNDYIIQDIEDEIVSIFNGLGIYKTYDYTKHQNLLMIRKRIINRHVLEYQDILLSDIRAFNSAVVDDMHKLYHRTQRVYEANSRVESKIKLDVHCYLDNKYPELHPIQGDGRDALWEALCDGGWNVLYKEGVGNACYRPNMTFEEFIYLGDTPSNWNEGLDRELTKDILLCYPFHNLFDHTCFALTDFIFCRKFRTEIHVEILDDSRCLLCSDCG